MSLASGAQVLGSQRPLGTIANQAAELLDDQLWPNPTWLQGEPPKRVRKYTEYLRDHLRTRYVELEGEFRMIYGRYPSEDWMDDIVARRTGGMLHQSRQALESTTPDLLLVSNLLDQIERCMLWLYPQDIADALSTRIRTRVKALPEPEQGLFGAAVEAVAVGQRPYDARQRSVYDEVLTVSNRYELQDQISRGLQIERLRKLLIWSVVLVIVFLGAFPMLAPPQVSGGPGIISRLWVKGQEAWLLALSVAFMGAVGGFLSGLLQVRHSRITLPEYQENIRKFGLRPLVGAIFALLLYTFLAWKVLAGVEIPDLGSYLLVAFLSGFSERYFLRLLNIESGDEMKPVDRAVPPAAAQPANTPPAGPPPQPSNH